MISIDLSKLAKEIASKYPTQHALADLMSSFKRHESSNLQALIGSKDLIPSFVEEFNRQQRETLRNYHDLFSSPAQTALKALFDQQSQEARRTEQAIGGQFEDAAEVNRQLLEQLSYTIEPVQGILDQIKADYAVRAPWFDQMKSAADHAAVFLDSLADKDADEDATDWFGLNEQLSNFEAAINQLPAEDATADEVRAAGLSIHQHFALMISLLSLLVGILAYIDTRAQGQITQQQYATEAGRLTREEAEDRAYRDRLIASIDAIAQRMPTRQLEYVVGPRQTMVRSAPGGGLMLGRIHPNQIVVVTGHEARWMKVWYRDHLDERDVEGWVLKHYLIRRELATTAFRKTKQAD